MFEKLRELISTVLAVCAFGGMIITTSIYFATNTRVDAVEGNFNHQVKRLYELNCKQVIYENKLPKNIQVEFCSQRH